MTVKTIAEMMLITSVMAFAVSRLSERNNTVKLLFGDLSFFEKFYVNNFVF